jgi:hypothetical protein
MQPGERQYGIGRVDAVGTIEVTQSLCPGLHTTYKGLGDEANSPKEAMKGFPGRQEESQRQQSSRAKAREDREPRTESTEIRHWTWPWNPLIRAAFGDLTRLETVSVDGSLREVLIKQEAETGRSEKRHFPNNLFYLETILDLPCVLLFSLT